MHKCVMRQPYQIPRVSKPYVCPPVFAVDRILSYRTDHRTHAPAAHDAAQTNTAVEMERPNELEWKALDRTGAWRPVLVGVLRLTLEERMLIAP